jgi:hypothetical protein
MPLVVVVAVVNVNNPKNYLTFVSCEEEVEEM